MGTSGWDDETRGRGRSSREARPREGERLPGRSSERGGYEYDRSERSGGKVRSRDDGWSNSDRSRAYPGRGERSSERDYDRGLGGASSPGGPGSSGRNRRPPRENYNDYADPRGRNGRDGHDMRPSRESRDGGGRSEREWSDERSVRGQRPPRRGEAPEAQQRRGPGGSGTRSSSSGRGGLWDGDAELRGRRPGRPGGSDPRARSMGAGPRDPRDPRDPRALRRGLVSEQAEPEATEETKGIGCGQAILVVLLMFVVGAGVGFAVFKMTMPKINADTATPAATTAPATTPSTSPQASPSAAPKGDTSHIWVASNASYGI
ncbi:MAG: hypothetical protein ACXWQR_16940 [Ktedonobacterales bacterium]